MRVGRGEGMEGERVGGKRERYASRREIRGVMFRMFDTVWVGIPTGKI